MKLNDLEIKLIALALNGAARGGEVGNAAEKLFNSFRRRGVKPEDIISKNGSSNDGPYCDNGVHWSPRRGETSGELRERALKAEEDVAYWQDLAEARLNVGEVLAERAISAHKQFHDGELVRLKDENARLERQFQHYVAPAQRWENIRGWAWLIGFALTAYGCAHGFH